MIKSLAKHNIDIRIWFDVPLLRDPMWQRIQILPEQYQYYLEDVIEFMEANKADETNIDFRGFKDFEIDKVKRNLEWMRTPTCTQEEIRQARANFYKFFSQHDYRRDTDFLKVFPEMKDWWYSCKNSNN
jgi:hypothetical protein